MVGRDPATGCSVQRSFTVHGDAEHAEARRRELVADFGVDLSVLYASGVSVGGVAGTVGPDQAWMEALDTDGLRAHRAVPP